MFIDSHCHLDFKEFDSDRAAVLEKAKQNRVSNILIPAVSFDSWNRTINISQRHHLPFALGLHPMFIAQHQPHHLSHLDSWLAAENPCAVGEIGLDFFDKQLDPDKQRTYFEKQLIIANRHQLPVIIHCRKAHDECIQLFNNNLNTGGIIHAFNGSVQQAWKYIEMGFLLGFGGMLTYSRSTKLRKLVQELPLSSIALETDAPDMTVAQHRGKRNSPAYIPLIAKAVAEIKAISVMEVAQITTDNVQSKLNLA